MGQRGRKSAAALSVAASTSPLATGRPIAPAELCDRAQSVWRGTVDSLPSGWFTSEAVPLLMAYCKTIARAERIEADLDGGQHELADADRLAKMLDREQRRALALARSLRVTKQAQARPEQAEGNAAGVDWSTISRKTS